jgi:hypothetical protein
MLHKTQDLRYILKNIDFDSLPAVEITQEFYEAQISLFKDFDKIDTTLQQLYIETIKDLINYIDTKTANDEQKCNISFHKYLKYCNSQYRVFEYNNHEYNDIYKIYEAIKKDYSWKDFLHKRVLLLNINLLNPKVRNEWNLYDEIAKLRMILNFDIDEFTTSVKKYQSLKDLAAKKSEFQQQKNLTRGKKN